VAFFYYAFIGASIAEVSLRRRNENNLTWQLASAMPSSGGVYHWASITPGPRAGRILGFFAGSINFFGWMFDLASIAQIEASVGVQMYAVFHPDLVIQPWQVYITYVMLTIVCVAFCIFYNRFIPKLQDAGLSIIVVAAMPKQHATSASVWRDWENATGWGGGVAFLTGVLNGAFTIGTPDSITHIAEELPDPKRDIPRAIFVQVCLRVLPCS
jgi:choline transport protein